MRVGMKVGPFYLSQSTRSRGRGASSRPTQAQLAARAAQRTATQAKLNAARTERVARYGGFTVADPRTWHTGHTLTAIVVLILVFSLPNMLGDGPAAGAVWAVAVVVGLVAWTMSVKRRHDTQAPWRQAGIAQRRASADQAAADVARARAAHAQYLAPRQVGNAWQHGACTVHHRSYDTALRCHGGGA